MSSKVGFTEKLKAEKLVEFCPFCRQKIKGHAHDCPEGAMAKAGLPEPKYCPLCGGEIEGGGHECPK